MLQDNGSQFKNYGIQLQNLGMQIQNFSMNCMPIPPDFLTQIQNMAIQITSIGIQIFNIGTQLSNMANQDMNMMNQNIMGMGNMNIGNMMNQNMFVGMGMNGLEPLNNNNINASNDVKANFFCGGKEPPPEVIPRSDQSISADFYQNIKNKMNLIMSASSGLTLIMPTHPNTPIKVFLRNYIKKLGLGEGVLGHNIIFLFNSEIIDINDDKPVSFFQDNASITVIDVDNVIGA